MPASGTSGVPAGSSRLVYSDVLTVAAATLDTGANIIPAGYSILDAYLLARTDEAATTSTVTLRFNGDSAAHYTRQYNGFTNVTGFSNNSTGLTGVELTTLVAGANAVANIPSPVWVSCPGYALTTFDKTGRAEVDIASTTATALQTYRLTWLWASTAAINQVTAAITSGVGQKFVAGSALYVYVR